MIKMLIVDDHALVREGLKHILEEHDGLRVVAEAATGEDAILKVKSIDCNLVLLDISMPGRGGLDALKVLRKIRPALPILVVSMYAEDQYALRTLRAGANGYVMKERPPEELVAAIRKVAAGGTYVSPSLAETLASQLGPGNQKRAGHDCLSNREDQVMRLIASGKSLKDIAAQLRLSVKTVSTYRRRLLQKMRMRTTAEVIRYAIENKLL